MSKGINLHHPTPKKYDDTTIIQELSKKVDKVDGKVLSSNDYTTTEKQEVAKIVNKVDKIDGKGLSDTNFTQIEKDKLAGIEANANKYDDTSIKQSLLNKVDKDGNKVLSDTNFTQAEKDKLASIEDSANKYSLPISSNSQLGGIKIGTGMEVLNDGTVNITEKYDDTQIKTELSKKADSSSVTASFDKIYAHFDKIDAHMINNNHVFVAVEGVTTFQELLDMDFRGQTLMVQLANKKPQIATYKIVSEKFKIRVFDIESNRIIPVYISKNDGWMIEDTQRMAFEFIDTEESFLPSYDLLNNTRYNVTAPVGTYAFKMSSGHASGIFTTDVAPAITFEPTAKFLGAKPEFKPSTTYEFDVQDNVWVFTEVVTA